MIKKYILIYLMVVSIPLFLALLVWQSHRYRNLNREITRLEHVQMEWIESNRRHIASITEYSSPARIEYLAQNHLGLRRIRPENLLQVNITAEGR